MLELIQIGAFAIMIKASPDEGQKGTRQLFVLPRENVITVINSLDILCMMIQRWTFIFIKYFVGPI